jgi:SAM-dependent methyltransferase
LIDAMATTETRFEFGKNWSNFISRNFSQERCDAAKKRLLTFIGRDSLEGLDFLDIGCGSGIHSLAAFQSGAGRIHSFDYDPNSVAATKSLHERAGSPANWHVERGDALDAEYIAKLGKWNFVYSWGVLHHTGQMWQAVRNAQSCVADGGMFFIALYSSDADFVPSKEFWLEIKQEYNRARPLTKKMMVWWYVWRFGMQENIRLLPTVLKQILTYKFQRGMNYFVDVRDWIGGWPMEYAGDQETVDLLEGDYGFELVNVATGHACSEFLFRRTGVPGKKTNVREFVQKRKTEAAPAEAQVAVGSA